MSLIAFSWWWFQHWLLFFINCFPYLRSFVDLFHTIKKIPFVLFLLRLFFLFIFFLFCLNEILTEKITYELATEIRFHWKWFCTMCCWTRKGNCISFTSLLRRKPLNKSTQMAKLWSKRMANATEKIFSFFFFENFCTLNKI